MTTGKFLPAFFSLIVGTVSAQTATYDAATGILSIPSVRVGNVTYTDVTLRDTGNYNFTLVSATAPQPPSTAEGLWRGSASNGRTVIGIVLDSGVYYVLYTVAGNPNLVAGFIQGNGTSSNGLFTSQNARDFNIEGLGVLSGTVSANYAARQSLNGTIFYSSAGTVSFTSVFDASYDIQPSVAAVAGTYYGQSAIASPLAGENATLTISPSGNVSGYGTSGCSFSGVAAPRAKGNAYNFTITFGGPPCLFPGQTFSGIAYYDALRRTLYAGAPNAARTTAVVYLGTR